MSNRLAVVSGRTLVKFLQNHGFKRDRQRGSHIIVVKPGEYDIEITVPDHKELKPKTLQTILKTAGVSREEYNRAMRRR